MNKYLAVVCNCGGFYNEIIFPIITATEDNSDLEVLARAQADQSAGVHIFLNPNAGHQVEVKTVFR